MSRHVPQRFNGRLSSHLNSRVLCQQAWWSRCRHTRTAGPYARYESRAASRGAFGDELKLSAGRLSCRRRARLRTPSADHSARADAWLLWLTHLHRRSQCSVSCLVTMGIFRGRHWDMSHRGRRKRLAAPVRALDGSGLFDP